MTTPLVDAQGFPRADLDVVAVRQTRHAIHRLIHDRHAINTKLAALLTQAWPAGGGSSTATEPSAASAPAPTKDTLQPRPIAVRSVAQASPATRAVRLPIFSLQGLQAGDELVAWGQLRNVTSAHFHDLAQHLQEDVALPIEVRRHLLDGRTVYVQLELVPSTRWEGRGMLGCHLVPT